ncbi:hypothetical protein BV20DRAFT_1058164 [Pilatotrama ljubarskyi]|nr:hypothetical protein BV20DRAFT_1058164 [Pilatotrama ljubarskyi]
MPRDTSRAFSRTLKSRSMPWRNTSLPPLRPRDLLAKPKPAHEPATPAERFTAALLDRDKLGQDVLKSSNNQENVTVRLSVEEVEGEVDGFFRDPSTYRLLLTLEPVLFMRRLIVVIDEFVGDEDEHRAPMWLARLKHVRGKSVQGIRIYLWVYDFARDLLTTPGQVPAQDSWLQVLQNFVIMQQGHAAPTPYAPVPAPVDPRAIAAGPPRCFLKVKYGVSVQSAKAPQSLDPLEMVIMRKNGAMRRYRSFGSTGTRAHQVVKTSQELPPLKSRAVRQAALRRKRQTWQEEVAENATNPGNHSASSNSTGGSRFGGSSFLTGVATPLWAFITNAFQPPTTSASALAQTSLFVNTIPALSSSSNRDLNLEAEPDCPTPRCGPQDELDTPTTVPILDDDGWEECGNDEATTEGPPSNSPPSGVLPTDVSAPSSSRTSGTSSGTSAPTMQGDTTPSASTSAELQHVLEPIALDEQAMAQLHVPDPFYSPQPFQIAARSAFELAHPAVVLAMLLVTWLHVSAHLPFRFCDVALTVIGYILAEAGQLSLVPLLRTSLRGCLSTLRLEPSFTMYPTCPNCLRPYPVFPATSRCRDCDDLLFKEEMPRRSQGKKQGHRASAKPRLRTPAKTITEQLADLLAQPGMEDAMSAWHQRSRITGWLYDFFDGLISRSLLGPDGKPFFRHDLPEDPDGELRIGLALGVDWFSYLRSLISPSYTSCPMSFNIVNLPPFLREADPDQTQHFLHIIVNELIRLWRDGIVVPTPRYPGGRRVRVILVGVFCDKPAAHKLGGFGSHAHTFFCTKDWLSQGLKATLAAFTPGGSIRRTDAQHRKMMAEYKALSTKADRDAYAKAFATRWSELARLPYFDLCRMIVVDPMHNLFLGLVKTHFYHIWIQLKIFRKSKEVRRLHEILAELTLPSKLGRLPRLVGEPAGGSLTADQWLILATVVGPLALPELWEVQNNVDVDPEFLKQRLNTIHEGVTRKKMQQQAKKSGAPAATNKPKAKQRAKSTTKESEQQPRRSSRPRKPTEKAQDMVLEADDAGAQLDSDDDEWLDDEEDEQAQTPRLHPHDLDNFLKLCTAIRLFLLDVISEAQLQEADKLIREYCVELIELYGPDVIRPNHHYATHTAEFIRDYGPLRGYWTFVFERLNKILKAYETNNHEGGEIECTFFREFYRTAQLHRMITQGLLFPSTTTFYMTCRLMQQATSDHRGTLQQLAEEIDELYMDENVACAFSPRSSRDYMDATVYYAFLAYMSARFPLVAFRSDTTISSDPASKLLVNMATFFDYVVVSGNRYYASSRSSSTASSLVLVRTSEAGTTHVGEIQHVVLYDSLESAGLARHSFVYVRWLRPLVQESFNGTCWETR